ncbi:hypothetical protein PG987_006570 [Apiospora arundinis]
MTRDFLLFMDDLIPEQRQKQTMNSPEWNNNDHVKYLYPDNADEPPRGCPGRADHRRDWIDINNTSRRIRRLGRESFFRVKVLALATSDLPTTKAKTTILTTTLTPLPPPNFALFGGDPSKMPPALMLTRKQRREQSQKEQTQMEQSQEQNQHSDPYKAADNPIEPQRLHAELVPEAPRDIGSFSTPAAPLHATLLLRQGSGRPRVQCPQPGSRGRGSEVSDGSPPTRAPRSTRDADLDEGHRDEPGREDGGGPDGSPAANLGAASRVYGEVQLSDLENTRKG